MCYPVECRRCGKTGWDGCGQHVDRSLGSVPDSERCKCRDNRPAVRAEDQRHRGMGPTALHTGGRAK